MIDYIGNIESLMMCRYKTMSLDYNSTTFKEVKDDTHFLFDCYSCLGVGTNVCDDHKPVFRFDKINGDYR